MKVMFDKLTDTAYIEFSKKQISETIQSHHGVWVDLDVKGRIVGIELFDVSKKIPNHSLEKFRFFAASQPAHKNKAIKSGG